jgi:ribonuclease P/MRP protein subunit RPP20
MFFQLKELLRWLGLTVFEIWIALVCFTIFTVLLTLKIENIVGDSLTWWIVFTPLFVSDALNAYFCVIVFIRMYLEVKINNTFINF